MPHLLALGAEVLPVVAVGAGFDGKLLGDLQAVTFQADDFLGIVGQQADGFQAQVGQNLRAQSVLAQVLP